MRVEQTGLVSFVIWDQITGKVKIHANVKLAAISPPPNHTTKTDQKDNIDQIAS